MALKDSHRMLLQSFMSRGILNGAEVKRQFMAAIQRFPEDNVDPMQLARFVNDINTQIKPMHLEIKKGMCEVSNTNYYGLMSTTESAVTKLASDYTVNELELFKKIVEAVVESDDGTVSSTSVLNLADTLEKKISKKDAQDLIDRMKDAKWLTSSAKGEISLSTRAKMELDLYIREQFTTVNCNLCNKLCLQGQLCGTCDCKIHLRCSARYFQDQEAPKCPSCSAPWPHEIPDIPVPASQRNTGNPQNTQSNQPATSSQLTQEPSNKRKKTR